jgi:hypothetical protein
VWRVARSLRIFFRFKGELPGRGHDSEVSHPNEGMDKLRTAAIFEY